MREPRSSRMALEACERCDGLVPHGQRVCLHCDQPRPWRRGARLAARLLGASAALVTLMACYGMIARPYDPSLGADGDGDGSPSGTDCDDSRADIFPGAPDLDGDGVDQSCDNVDGWYDPAASPPQANLRLNPPAPPTPATPPAVIATDPVPDPAPPPPTPPPAKVLAVDPPAARP